PMAHLRVSRRRFLIGAGTAGAALALGAREAPAQKKAASLRLWILKTYVEPTNKAVEASAQRWAAKHGGTVTVEYFTFEDMQTKYVAAIENKNTPDVGQLETSAPARFAGLGQSWNRTADGYGVMQSLMYSYGAGWATRDGKYRSLKTPAMQKVMRWATDIYKEGIQPADTLTWTGSGNNENFIAHNIAQTS